MLENSVFIPVFLSHYAPRTLKKCILLKLSISWLLNSLEYNGVGRLVWNCSLPNHHSIRNINLSIHFCFVKVEKDLKGSLDSILLPSPSVKIQIMGGKVYFRYNGKTLLDDVNKILKTKSLLKTTSNVLHSHLKQTFLLIIWIFTEGEGNRIKPMLPFKIFSTV